MSTSQSEAQQVSALRKQAAAVVDAQSAKFDDYSPRDLPELARELAVQREMLRMQQEYLRRCRLQLELAKNAGSDFFWSVFDTADALIIVLDRHGHIVQFNRACEELSGFSFKDLKGQLLWDTLLPPTDQARIAAEYATLGADQFPKKYESSWIRRDGKRCRIGWTDTALLDSQQQVQFIIGIGIDITQRTEIEEAYRVLVEHSLQGLVIFQNDRIVFANTAIANITGYTVKEIKAMDIEQILAILYPADRSKISDRHQARKAGNATASRAEVRFVTKNGAERWIETNTNPIEFRGRPALQVVLLDITERKLAEAALRESEELHRVTISNISDAVFITDDDGRFTYICSNVNKIFGYSVDEAKRLGNIFELLGPNIFDPAELAAAGELQNIERIALDKTGVHRVLLINVKRVSIGDGTTLYTCHEITDRKQADIERKRLFEATSAQREQLRALTGQLAEAQEAERKALARELHDYVGQKLTSLNLNLNTLRARLSSASPNISAITAVVDHSLKLVEETTESIQDVMINLRPPVLDDYGLLAALQWYGAEMEQDVNFSIRVFGKEPSPRLPATTEHALYRITQEALTNVIKHSMAGHVTIHLEQINGLVRLSITDDGQGFNPAHRLRLSGRSGWGLFTMMERAEAVGGNCQIKSRVGQGTQIIVEIPR